MEPHSPSPPGLLPPLSLDDLTKIGAGAVVGLYAIGYLVVALYLVQFGLVPSDLLRARFVAVGLVTVVPALVVLLHGWFLLAALRRRVRDPRQIAVATLVSLLPLLEIPLALAVLPVALPPSQYVRWAIAFTLLPWLPVATVALAERLDRILIGFHYAAGEDRRRVQAAGRVVTIVAGGAASLPYLAFVAQSALPHVPPQLGGVAPLPAQLVIDHLHLDEARGLGLPLTGNLTDRLEILWEDSGSVVVRWQESSGPLLARVESPMIDAVRIDLLGAPALRNPLAPPPNATPAPASGAPLP